MQQPYKINICIRNIFIYYKSLLKINIQQIKLKFQLLHEMENLESFLTFFYNYMLHL